MRRAAKIDANHVAIRDALRAIPGVTVKDAAHVGGGFPDLVIGVHGKTVLIEVKDGAKVPSARKLTPAQVRFRAAWSGSPIWVVESVGQAVDLVIREMEATNDDTCIDDAAR